MFWVTPWEGYLASPESFFDSEIVKTQAWKQSPVFLCMTYMRKCNSQIMSAVYNQPNLWKFMKALF